MPINQQTIRKQNIEILAPAGSYESFQAAVAAGADAVYAAGSRFGARAFAENFTEEQLLASIDYAHLHGRRFYLTVNTLLKNQELEDLPKYLEPLYRQGLDAVIVQDIGVLELVRRYFPDMEIHASTQMTLTGAYGANFLKKQGVLRVVPARELSLAEIRRLKKETKMEIECFVHGALCYCYSGQCLFSSMAGGRSGNRGQCAQPCRLPYTIGKENGYLLSPKDICALDLIPELIEAGVDSFKIEGRMKRPEYVAGVTALYRKYTDLYLNYPEQTYHVEKTDKEQLMDLFNRGGFHTGYFHQRNGRSMMALERPDHIGVAAARVLMQKGREVHVRALTDIQKEDLLEYPDGSRYTCGQTCKAGKEMMILAPKNCHVKQGDTVRRIRNPHLLKELESTYVHSKTQEKICGRISLHCGESARLKVWKGEIWTEVFSDLPVEPAAKSPLTEKQVHKQINKTGNTDFIFDTIDIDMEENLFIPMQQLNEMRRTALEQLGKNICSSYRREIDSSCLQKANNNYGKETDQKPGQTEFAAVPFSALSEAEKKNEKLPFLSVLVETEEQLRAVCEELLPFSEDNGKSGNNEYGIRRIYIESSSFSDYAVKDSFERDIDALHRQNIELYIAMPRIFRDRTAIIFKQEYEKIFHKTCDGILVRNYDEFGFLREYGFDKKMILDHNLYVMNHWAKKFWTQEELREYTAPLELNKKELSDLDIRDGELLLYGRIPMMVSAQCVQNTVSGCAAVEKDRLTDKNGRAEKCTENPEDLTLRDRYRNEFPVRNFCRDCYSVIYNSVPLCLFEQAEEVRQLNAAGYRIQFSVETADEIRDVLALYRDVFLNGKRHIKLSGEYTKGHFHRGVS